MAVNELQIGNLNCIFLGGKYKFDMLDYWNEFVHNVFKDEVASNKKYDLLMRDVKYKKISGQEVIIGRYIKKTELEINQTLEDGMLQKKFETHSTAPSSIFVYLLKNHILLYVGEHKGYPSVKSFTNHIKRNINRERSKYLRKLVKGIKKEERLPIYEQNPPPYVSYVPMPATSKLDEEFDDLEKITSIKIRQFYQNGNFSTDTFTKTNVSLMEAVKASKIDTSLSTAGDIDGAKEVLNEISNNTEALFTLEGKTKEGKKQITNDGIKYSQNLELISDDIDHVAEKMVGTYSSDVANKRIPNIPQKNSDEKLKVVNYE